MNRFLIGLLFLSVGVPAALPETAPELEPFVDLSTQKFPAEWQTDHAAALVRAREGARYVLLAFTSDDDAAKCQRLRKQILTQKPFLAYAGEKLVLVEVDFPRTGGQPAALKEQNGKLKEQYAVTSYPTVILTDVEGRELGRTGYMQGGPKTFVRELKRLSAGALKLP